MAWHLEQITGLNKLLTRSPAPDYIVYRLYGIRDRKTKAPE